MLISKVTPQRLSELYSWAVAEGDRIAQLVLEKIYTPAIVEVESLAATERGVGGFGSTGK
jgi:dUTP pyrophosphatase